MRTQLFCVLLLGPLAGFAQAAGPDAGPPALLVAAATAVPAFTPLPTRADAVRKLEKMKRTIALLTHELRAFKTRPQVALILAESADDFVQIATGLPTEEAYFQALDYSLAQLTPLTRAPDDRIEVAEYYEDLLDIVGVKSSAGRLNAFVVRPRPARPPHLPAPAVGPRAGQ